MRAVLAGLELVLLAEGDAGPVAEAGLLHAVGDDVLGHVGGISEAVDVADLVAVVGGDGDLGDVQAGIVQLDDDLGVEVEPVRVALEGDLLQGVDRVGAVSRVELGQLGPEGGVLEPREDPVAHVLVEGHPALAGGALDHGPGPEDGVGLAGDEGGKDVGQRLRRVLAVTVEHDHDVEPVLDGQAVAGLLVAAVAEVVRLADEGDGQVGDLLVAEPDQVGRVLAVVVADDDLFDVAADGLGDAVEHPSQGGRRVVGHHQDPDPFGLGGPGGSGRPGGLGGPGLGRWHHAPHVRSNEPSVFLFSAAENRSD